MIPAGATPTGPCTLRLPTGGTQTFAELLDGAARSSSRVEPGESASRAVHRLPRLDHRCTAGRTTTACCCRFSGVPPAASATNANYTISTCEGLISQGQAPLNVATGYMIPVSLINPPSDAEREAHLRIRQGAVWHVAQAHLQPECSVETPQFDNPTVRALASGWRLSGIYRANSGAPLTVFTGTDRALSGIQATTQRANQVLDNPYGDGTINNWLNPPAFQQPALGTYGNSVRNAYDGPGGRSSTCRSCGRSGSATRTASRRASRRSTRSTGSCWRTRTRRCQPRPSGASLASGDPRIMQFAVKYDF